MGTTFDDVSEDGSVSGLDAEFTEVNGIRTRYYEMGADNDEVLLLVHGGSWGATTSANTWTPVLDGLSDRFHVIAPDRLACGMTGNPTDESPYDWAFESELEFVKDFLDERGIEQCHACGSSRGMASLSWLASEHPGRISTLVCLNSNTLGPPVGDYGHRRVVLDRGAPTDPESPTHLEDQLRHTASVWNYNPDRAISPEEIRAQAYIQTRPKFEEAREILDGGAYERIEQNERHEFMDGIRAELHNGAISQPILLYWGRHDLTCPLRMGLDLYERISQGNPNVRLYVVDRAGHLPYHEFPEEFVRKVTGFVDHWKDNRRSMEDVRPREYANYYK